MNLNNKDSVFELPNFKSKVKKVIGVVSGKGGVGKSLVTSMLASLAQKSGLKTAILDADITGPSIPKSFGIKEKATGTETAILPVKTKSGIKVMSINLLLENETDPVLWRGPLISGTIKQFWQDVAWGDIDIMFIDMPPGTGDIALTIYQSIPLNGLIIVSSPQELVTMIVEKALKMANTMNIPLIGMVENMSYVQCPNCDEKIYIYGDSKVDEVAQKYNIKNTAKIPLDPNLRKYVDNGDIESYENKFLENFSKEILK